MISSTSWMRSNVMSDQSPLRVVVTQEAGGFAGLPARSWEVSAASLDADAAVRLAGLAAAALAQRSGPTAPSRGADQLKYRVRIDLDGESLDLRATDGDGREALHELIAFVREQSRGGRPR
jgi:hypothetical protein